MLVRSSFTINLIEFLHPHIHSRDMVLITCSHCMYASLLPASFQKLTPPRVKLGLEGYFPLGVSLPRRNGGAHVKTSSLCSTCFFSIIQLGLESSDLLVPRLRFTAQLFGSPLIDLCILDWERPKPNRELICLRATETSQGAQRKSRSRASQHEYGQSAPEETSLGHRDCLDDAFSCEGAAWRVCPQTNFTLLCNYHTAKTRLLTHWIKYFLKANTLLFK